jgi:hypothetical protein
MALTRLEVTRASLAQPLQPWHAVMRPLPVLATTP